MVSAYAQFSDRDLVIACQRREQSAFEELVKRYQRTVYSLFYQLAPDWSDTADLSQEAFIRVWRSINNLRNPSSFRSWLTQIVTNLFYDELRKRPRQLPTLSIDNSREEEDKDGPSQDIVDTAPQPDDATLNREIGEVIRKAMASLPEQFRTAIVLRELEGLSYEEISLLTKTEIGTVKSRIARARIKLQELLKPYLEATSSSKGVPL
jgi:RNA polymerase sigma-70 factor (ECF subfamily)